LTEIFQRLDNNYQQFLRLVYHPFLPAALCSTRRWPLSISYPWLWWAGWNPTSRPRKPAIFLLWDNVYLKAFWFRIF